MPVIALFNGMFCMEDLVINEIIARTGYKKVTNQEITRRAAARSGIPESKIKKAFSARTSVFNKFTHEKEYSIAWLKFVLAEILSEENLVIKGFSSLLIPDTITHVLRVCIISDTPSRIQNAIQGKELDEKEASNVLRQDNADRSAWTEMLFSLPDPWDSSLFDIMLPTGKTEISKLCDLIEENILKDVVHKTEASNQAVKDFYLSSKTEVKLLKAGHDVQVNAKNGVITLTINKHVLMLKLLKEELKEIVENIHGVTSIKTVVGQGFHKSNIYRKHDFDVPSRVLLVDDEREFAQTLSERLQLRDMGSVVAFDGETAMTLVKEDDPEVMIIDLKMPDIDGIEILKKVKQTRPEIEVIVLTGHGSEADKNQCMELGAFAYLQKPVDINYLSETLKKAHERIEEKSKKESFQK